MQEARLGARRLLEAFVSAPTWVRRRDEVYTLVNNRTNHRIVRLELAPGWYEMVGDLVPLGTADATPMVRRAVTDETGRHRALLNNSEERELVASALADASTRAERNRLGEFSYELRRDHLHEIRDFLEFHEGSALWERGPFYPGTIKALLFESVFDLITPLINRRISIVEGDPSLTTLTLVQHDPADFVKPPRGGKTHAKSFSFKYTEDYLELDSVAREGDVLGNGLTYDHDAEYPFGYWQWRRRPDDLPLKIPVTDVLGAASTHVDCIAPEGTYISRSVLLIVAQSSAEDIPVATDDETDGSTSRQHAIAEDLDSDGVVHELLVAIDEDADYSGSRHHILADDIPPSGHVHEAALAVVIRPLYWGYLRPAALVSAISSIFLVGIAFIVIFPAVGAYGFPFENHLDGRPAYQADALVAVLLLAPSLFLAGLIRRNEHVLAGVALWRTRLRLGILLCALMATAAVVAVGAESNRVAAAGFAVALVAGCVSTLSTITSARVSRRETSSRSSQER